MTETRFFFNPATNRITAQYSPQCHEITRDEVAALVRKGAEVEQSARDLNALLKQQEGQ